jgi:glycine/D-amino acid oxidase-like deaminating enzyme
VPLVESVGVLAHAAPQPPLAGPVVLAPGAHVLQRPDGRVVTGRDFAGTAEEEVGALTGERLLAAAARFFPALDGVAAERITIGHRVMPADGLPLVGRAAAVPELYVVATHSGISLAPILGRLAATEVLDEVEVDGLTPFRLGRANWAARDA